MRAPTYAEDIEVGRTFLVGDYEMTTDEVEGFRNQWDPLLKDLDDGDPPLASGMHSIAVFQRLASIAVLGGWAIVAGRRLREVAFEAPVRAGMVLTGEMVVDEIAERSPDTSYIVFTGILSHEDVVVLRVTHEAIVRRRPVATG